MKNNLVFLGLTVLFLCMLFASAVPGNPGDDGKKLDRKRVILIFEEDAGRDVIRGYGVIKKEFKLIKGLSADMTDDEITELQKIPGVRVFEDRIVHAVLDDSVPMISADQVHSAGVDGSGVRVCVVDSGVDDNHPALNPLVAEVDYVNSDDPDATDDNGHGTHVAGIVASQDAMYKGVAPGASLMAAKVLDSTGSGMESWVIAGIDWCVANNADVITLSLGMDYSGDCDTEAMGLAVNNAVARGVVVTAAAGNGGRDVILPACASGPIAVAVVDKSNVLPWWSSRGLEVDITAPGVSIYSTYLNNGWASMSGTSMATPHVAGTAALLLQTKPTATVAEIKEAIYNTADPVSRCYQCTRWFFGSCLRQSEVACTPELVGHGLVNAYEAYLAVKPAEPDSDGDGVPDSQDACPNIYGTGCNGCPDPCSGCAVMSCPGSGAPTCKAGSCPDTVCPGDGCGVGDCASNEYGKYTPADNLCLLDGNAGTCENNLCTLACAINPVCEAPVKCWSSSYNYLRNGGDSNQLKKFCKCAQGAYSYKGYRTSQGTKKAYWYSNSGDNLIWDTISGFVYRPVYNVRCSDGVYYPTSVDYYYG